MNSTTLLERLAYLDYLVRLKQTGTPKELAAKLGLSERGWYKFREELVEDLKWPLAYCSHRKTYYYTTEGSFVAGFKPLSAEKKEQTRGGSVFVLGENVKILQEQIHTAWRVQWG